MQERNENLFWEPGFVGGLVFVICFAAVLTWLCVRTNKTVKTERAVKVNK